MKFLYILILFFATYYLLKAFLKLFRMILSTDNKNTRKNQSKNDITIEGSPSRLKRSKKQQGEYVDYEELKEN